MSYNYNRTIRNAGYEVSEELQVRTVSQSTDAWDTRPDAQEKPEQSFWAFDAQEDDDMECSIYWAN